MHKHNRNFTSQFGSLIAATSLAVLGLNLASGQAVYHRIRSFGFPNLSAVDPSGGLIEGTNGMLYGVTDSGGESGHGTVFRLNGDGTGFAQLISFTATNGDGDSPTGSLCLGTNGVLYGTTWTGGYSNLGTVYQINQDGSGYRSLWSFVGTNGDGAMPYFMGLIQARNGSLWAQPQGWRQQSGHDFQARTGWKRL